MQDSWESAPEEMWLGQANFEAYKHKSMRYQRGRGTCVLFILDFSESMRGEGIITLKRAVSDILDEFSKHPELDENVAVIVFGKETKFLQYYSNHYTTINQSIEDLEPIGASPLTAAFLLALGGLFEGSASTHVVGDFLLPPRVVVFTDGRLTNFADNGAKEHEADFFPSHQLLTPLFSITHRIGKNHPIYCFPIGDTPNISLLHTISIKSKGGQMLDIGRARWFGRHTVHYRTADTIYRMTNKTIVDRGVLNNFVQSIMNGQAYQEEDLDTIRELLNNRAPIMVDQVHDDEDSEDEFYKEKYTVPKVGTRVRRGPHWIYKNQDCEGAGTIVGHGESAGIVNVEWDTGIRCNYSHGYGGIYNVVVCDEPRIPEDGFAAVGCFVKRGSDWKWEDQDGGIGSIGIVYRLKNDATVYVRWPSGRKGNYRFGYNGKFDVEVCDPFSPEVNKAVKDQQRGTQSFDGMSLNNLKDKVNQKDSEKTEIENIALSGPIEKTDNAAYNGTKSKRTQTVDSKKRYSKIREMSNDQKYTKTNIGADDTVTDDDDDDIQTDSVYKNSFGCGCSERGTSDFVTDSSSSDKQTKHEKLGVGALDSSKESHNTVSLKRKSLTIDKTFDASDVNKTSSSQKGNFDSMTEGVISVAGNLNRCWQWLDSRGVWIDYPDEVNDQINHRLQQRPNASVVVKCKEQRCFRIVPSKSIQINIESKERHSIRWQNSK